MYEVQLTYRLEEMICALNKLIVPKRDRHTDGAVHQTKALHRR